MAETRDDYLFMSTISEQCERYDDMTNILKKVVELDGKLSNDERNSLSVAYKHVIGSRRQAWRTYSAIEQRADVNNESGDAVAQSPTSTLAGKMRTEIEDELTRIGGDVIEMIDKHLIPNADEVEAKVFFWKMKADYHRYMCEYASGSDREKRADESLEAYKKANEIACESLPTTNAIRLGLALNFSVFYYEILGNHEKACRLAKAAFDDAMRELDLIADNSSHYKDCTVIMQLLRDNLTLWATDIEVDSGDENGVPDADQKPTDVSNGDVKGVGAAGDPAPESMPVDASAS